MSAEKKYRNEMIVEILNMKYEMRVQFNKAVEHHQLGLITNREFVDCILERIAGDEFIEEWVATAEHIADRMFNRPG